MSAAPPVVRLGWICRLERGRALPEAGCLPSPRFMFTYLTLVRPTRSHWPWTSSRDASSRHSITLVSPTSICPLHGPPAGGAAGRSFGQCLGGCVFAISGMTAAMTV